MRVMLFAAAMDRDLAEALAAEGLAPDARALPAAEGGEASGTLVAGLRGASEALAGEKPDAVLVAGVNDAALAVTLTAVKLQIPTGWLHDEEAATDGLVARVADASLDASAAAGDLAAQVRALAARKLPAP